jgi:hypothetical protein
MTPRSKKLLALVTYGISLYARVTCESTAQHPACRRKCRIDPTQRGADERPANPVRSIGLLAGVP